MQKTNYLVKVIDRQYHKVIEEYNIRCLSAKNALLQARAKCIYQGVDYCVYQDLGDTLELRLSRVAGETVFVHPFEE